MRDEVDRAAATFADIKNRSPQEAKEFISKPENRAQVSMAKGIDKIAKELTHIRKAINYTLELPESKMSSAEKQIRIEKLKQTEEHIFQQINLKKLRERAMI